MRNEATLEMWRELYYVAINIKSLKPWEYFWDMDLITILQPNLDEPVYCSIMGRGGEFFGIGTYVGFHAIDGFFKVANDENVPVEQIARYQNILMCTFGNRDQLRKNELDIIKNLGFKFRGKNNWIYFECHEPGYGPYILDYDEVILLTEVFKNLFMAIRAYTENNMKVDFKNGETLLRRYDEKDRTWYTYDSPMIFGEIEYDVPVLQDDLLIARLKKEKYNNKNIEIDIMYFNMPINDKNLHKPILPKMIVMADCQSGEIIKHSILNKEDEDVHEIMQNLISYITQFGRPKTIFVRDEYIQSLLIDLCKRLKINLNVKGNLDDIDEFTREFYKFRL